MRTERSWLLRRGACVLAISALILPGAPAVAMAGVVEPTTLWADIAPQPSADPDASGFLSVVLDSGAGSACYELDVVLTDLAGDPPTSFGIYAAADGGLVLGLGTTVDGSGHAAGCATPVSSPVIAQLTATPAAYYVTVLTAAYPAGVLRGPLDYATGALDVHTKVCPAEIQTIDRLTASAKATCLDVVLPADQPVPPAGFTVTDFGGTATFDYHVTDGVRVDATIADAQESGGGTCSDATKTCSFPFLPYSWNLVSGSATVTPTMLPSGTRFAAAEAGEFGGGPVPVTLGVGNAMSIDTTSSGDWISVYLFRTPDTTAPTVGVPTVNFRTGGTLGSTAPVRLAWSASDAGSGLDHYAVQAQIDGVTKTLAAKVTTKAYSTTEAVGHTYRYRVIAYDKAGNHRASAWTAVEHLVIRQDTYPWIVYSGGWAKQLLATASGGTVHFSKAATAAVKLTFTGRSVAWVAPKSLARGSARVYVDSKLVTTVSLYGTAADRLVEFSQRWSTVGTHTIRVVVVGTSGHPRVDVDAFLVLN